jgi:hypothetical protein
MAWIEANPFKGAEWHGELFGSLCAQVFSEFQRLSRTYDQATALDISALAWSARNLLELSVWCQTFSQSFESARALYDSATRDSHDLLQAFGRWERTANFPPDWHEPISSEGGEQKIRAIQQSIEAFAFPYVRVRTAAEQCGIAKQFALHYQLLSRFVHPPALQFFATGEDGARAEWHECFFALGCLFFTHAVEALEDVPA